MSDERDIVDVLAERFYRMDPRRVDFRAWSSLGGETKAPYLRYASEAVRLGLYSIHRQCQKSHGEDYKHALSKNPAVALELAPAEWVPSA